MTDDESSLLRSLFPARVGPHPVQPIFHEVIWKQVQDIGHEQDAYYQLGWRCVSRHEKYALLCREMDHGPLLQFLIMTETGDGGGLA